MYCTKCGKEIADYARTCPGCGAAVFSESLLLEEEVSLGDWMITFLLLAIPLVGIIMLFVWAFSSGTKSSKQNWARAILVWALIAIGLSIVLGSALAALLASALG